MWLPRSPVLISNSELTEQSFAYWLFRGCSIEYRTCREEEVPLLPGAAPIMHISDTQGLPQVEQQAIRGEGSQSSLRSCNWGPEWGGGVILRMWDIMVTVPTWKPSTYSPSVLTTQRQEGVSSMLQVRKQARPWAMNTDELLKPNVLWPGSVHTSLSLS